MTLEQVRESLKDRNICAVAERTGLHPNTIYRLMSPDSRPAWQTVAILSDYLEGKRRDK